MGACGIVFNAQEWNGWNFYLKLACPCLVAVSQMQDGTMQLRPSACGYSAASLPTIGCLPGALLITCCPNCNSENTHSATAEDGGTVNISFAAFLHDGRLSCSSCLCHYLAVSVTVVMALVVAM